jgi:acyl transferase domain-containing protein
MGRALYEAHAGFRHELQRLDALATSMTGSSILAQLYDDHLSRSDTLAETSITHPAIFMLEVALAEVLKQSSVVPDLLLGSSLGTFAAAVVAGCIGVEDALAAVIQQAQLLQRSCPRGGMVAILESPRLYQEEPVLRQHSTLAAINFPRHFVVSALPEALTRIERVLRERNVMHQRLAVSLPFHSQWMEGAEVPCRAALAALTFRPPRTPLYLCTHDCVAPSLDANAIWKALREPILTQKALELLESRGNYRYIDVGPSGTMATFTKYNLAPGSTSVAFPILTPFGHDAQNLQRLLA